MGLERDPREIDTADRDTAGYEKVPVERGFLASATETHGLDNSLSCGLWNDWQCPPWPPPTLCQ